MSLPKYRHLRLFRPLSGKSSCLLLTDPNDATSPAKTVAFNLVELLRDPTC